MLPPHELKKDDFQKAVRGYNPVEVDEYIDFVISKYTELYRENDELQRKLNQAEAELEKFQSDEDSIRGALINAQRASARIKAGAQERAEAIIRSAKESCNTILADFNLQIEAGRKTLEELQHSAFLLKQELLCRYSEHIEYIDKLTENLDEEHLPDLEKLRKEAIESLKDNLADQYSSPETEKAGDGLISDVPETPIEEAPDVNLDFLDHISDEPVADAPAEPEIKPEPKRDGLKSAISELNKQYKESVSAENTQNGIGEADDYISIIDSVTTPEEKPAQEFSKEENDVLDEVFDNGKKKKKNKNKKRR